MSKTEIEYIIEFRNLSKSQYSRGIKGFKSREVAFNIAENHRKTAPELKVRVVEQTRRILRVL